MNKKHREGFAITLRRSSCLLKNARWKASRQGNPKTALMVNRFSQTGGGVFVDCRRKIQRIPRNWEVFSNVILMPPSQIWRKHRYAITFNSIFIYIN